MAISLCTSSNKQMAACSGLSSPDKADTLGLQVFLEALTMALVAVPTTGKKVDYMCMLFWEIQHTYQIWANNLGTSFNCNSGQVRTGAPVIHAFVGGLSMLVTSCACIQGSTLWRIQSEGGWFRWDISLTRVMYISNIISILQVFHCFMWPSVWMCSSTFKHELNMWSGLPHVKFNVQREHWTEHGVQFSVQENLHWTGPNWTCPSLNVLYKQFVMWDKLLGKVCSGLYIESIWGFPSQLDSKQEASIHKTKSRNIKWRRGRCFRGWTTYFLSHSWVMLLSHTLFLGVNKVQPICACQQRQFWWVIWAWPSSFPYHHTSH